MKIRLTWKQPYIEMKNVNYNVDFSPIEVGFW